MKNKFYIIIVFFLVSVQSLFAGRDVLIFQQNPQTRKADFEIPKYPNLEGWYIKDLKIAEDYTSGFKIRVDFSVPQTLFDNATVFRLGAVYNEGNTQNYHNGYILKLEDNTFKTERLISFGDDNKLVTYSAWDKNLLKKGHNYSLIFEIDETRLRITTYEDENMDIPMTEYEFNGLSHSHLRTILSGKDHGIFNTIGICLDKRIAIHLLSVYTLSNAVEVDNPQTTNPFIAYIKANSGFYIRPKDGDTKKGAELEVNTLQDPTWSMWEITPLYDNKRTTANFKAKLRNIQSNRYMVVKNGSTADLAPISQWSNGIDNNTIWDVHYDKSGKVTLQNELTQKYAVVKDASMSVGAKVVQYSTAFTPNSSWLFLSAGFNTPKKSGYYRIKNINSGLYLGLGSELTWIRQEPMGIYGTSDIWHVEEQPGGLYTIKNVYKNQYLVENFLKMRPYPYPYVADLDPEYGKVGTSLWALIQYNSGIEIVQAHHKEDLVVENASKQAGAYCRLWAKNSATTPSANALWEFIPVDYTLDVDLGGFYKIKYASTNQYLVVKDASSSENQPVISYPTANTNNARWYLRKTDVGGYLIYNVNSNLLLTNTMLSLASDGFVTQNYKRNNETQKSQEWRVYHSNEQNKFLISSYDGGNGLTFAIPTMELTQAITTSEHTADSKWIFEPVVLPVTHTRSINMEPEDGIFEIIPTTEISKNNSVGIKNTSLPIDSRTEAYCVGNDLLAKSDCIIKSIDIYDFSGRLMGKSKVSNYFTSIDVSKLSKGTYIAVIHIEESESKSIKFIKQ